MGSGDNFMHSDASNAYGIWIEAATNVYAFQALSCIGKYHYIDIANQNASPTQDAGIWVDTNASVKSSSAAVIATVTTFTVSTLMVELRRL